MPFPIASAIGTGLGIASSAFHKNPKYHPGVFNFQMDPNDPELQLLRRRALFDIQRGHSSTVDEVSRAGLLGSSAGFAQLADQQLQGDRALRDVDLSTFARRRLEALQLFRDQENFKMQQALGGQQHEFNMQDAALSGLGDIGSFLGQGLEEYYRPQGYNPRTGDPRLDALLTDASYGGYQTPNRRY